MRGVQRQLGIHNHAPLRAARVFKRPAFGVVLFERAALQQLRVETTVSRVVDFFVEDYIKRRADARSGSCCVHEECRVLGEGRADCKRQRAAKEKPIRVCVHLQAVAVMMAAVQMMCARLGMVTGRGLAGVVRSRYPRWVLWGACALLAVANIINRSAVLVELSHDCANLQMADARTVRLCPRRVPLASGLGCCAAKHANSDGGMVRDVLGDTCRHSRDYDFALSVLLAIGAGSRTGNRQWPQDSERARGRVCTRIATFPQRCPCWDVLSS